MTKYHILRRFKYLKDEQWHRGEHESYGYYHDKKDAEARTKRVFDKKYPRTIGVKFIAEELL